MAEYVIEMLNITKVFPGIKANDNITLQLRPGEIHALDRKSTRLNSSHKHRSRMPSSA